MYKYYFIFFCLFSCSLSGIQRMKKNNGFDDNVCAYTYSSITYVKPCEEGKYCKDIDHGMSICQDLPTIITPKTLNEDCNSDFDCETNLFCYKGHCSQSSTTSDYCSSSQTAVKTSSGYQCQEKDYIDYCTYRKFDTTTHSVTESKYLTPDIFRVCGKITFHSQTLPNDKGTYYQIEKVEKNYIGTVDDGEFVGDVKACKSGYALYFYPGSNGGSLDDPSTDPIYQNTMRLKCVSVDGVTHDDYNSQCIIKYDGDKIYNTGHYGSFSQSCSVYTMTKIELFKKYIEKFSKDMQEKCATKENYNETETCNDNEIRKWKYFYDNPEDYILFYDEEGKNSDIVTYLIQQKYPSYQSSGFLNIKYFICLLLLFSF